jgi:hypothetical protein
MTAADRLAQLHIAETLRDAWSKSRWLIVALLVATTLAYCDGSRHGAAVERLRVVDSVRSVFADSSRIIEQRLEAHAPLVQQAVARVDTIRVAYERAAEHVAEHVAILDDSTVSVDSAPPTHSLPASLVIPELRVCAQLDTTSTAAIRVQAAQIADLTTDRNTWRDRALLDEANTPTPPRFGLRTGIAIGATIAVVLLHLLP